MRTLIIATFYFGELSATAQVRAETMLDMELDSTNTDMNFFSDGTLCPVKEGPCYHNKDDKESCVVGNQNGEPYCHTHGCSPSDPCIVQGCPHCVGEQEIMSRGDQGNDSLGLGTPDPAVVGGKDLPFKEDSRE